MCTICVSTNIQCVCVLSHNSSKFVSYVCDTQIYPLNPSGQVAPLTVITEYMVVLEGNSRPQNQAIAQNIEEKMEEAHQRTPKTQVGPSCLTPGRGRTVPTSGYEVLPRVPCSRIRISSKKKKKVFWFVHVTWAPHFLNIYVLYYYTAILFYHVFIFLFSS